MSERQAGPYDRVARRWLALVERRQEHVIELWNSGRWRHYFTREELIYEMHRVLGVRDQWAAILGMPMSCEMSSGQDNGLQLMESSGPAAATVAAPLAAAA